MSSAFGFRSPTQSVRSPWPRADNASAQHVDSPDKHPRAEREDDPEEGPVLVGGSRRATDSPLVAGNGVARKPNHLMEGEEEEPSSQERNHRSDNDLTPIPGRQTTGRRLLHADSPP